MAAVPVLAVQECSYFFIAEFCKPYKVGLRLSLLRTHLFWDGSAETKFKIVSWLGMPKIAKRSLRIHAKTLVSFSTRMTPGIKNTLF